MYYFIQTQTNTIIKDWSAGAISPDNKDFTPLTQEQIDFYLANPHATINEVRNCILIEQQDPPQEIFNLAEYKTEILEKINTYSLNTLGKFVCQYQLGNALLSLSAPAELKIYDDEKSNEYKYTFLRIGKICRDKYYNAEIDINNYNTKTELDEWFNIICSEYDSIE